MARTNCRDCQAPIDWAEKEGGGWYPIEPRSGKPHRCELPQKCEQCQKEFKGAPWMKVCSDCYRAGSNGDANPKPAPAARQPEPLNTDVPDDENPF